MPVTTQCTKPRASGSSMTSASSDVPSGVPDQRRGIGESPPSHPCSVGICPPSAKAGLVRLKSITDLPVGVGEAVSAVQAPGMANDRTAASVAVACRSCMRRLRGYPSQAGWRRDAPGRRRSANRRLDRHRLADVAEEVADVIGQGDALPLVAPGYVEDERGLDRNAVVADVHIENGVAQLRLPEWQIA